MFINIEIRYGERIFHYELQTNEKIIVLSGASGRGKSTFINALVGMEKVSGFIKIGGNVWHDSENGISIPTASRALAWVPQNVLLFPHLSARKNLEFGIQGSRASREFDELIDVFQLRDILERPPSRLSGGEKQRVAIGRALLATLRFKNNGVLLLDEPFAALDKELVGSVSRFVSRWCIDRRITSVYSVHEIDRIGDYAAYADTEIAVYLLRKNEFRTKIHRIALREDRKDV